MWMTGTCTVFVSLQHFQWSVPGEVLLMSHTEGGPCSRTCVGLSHMERSAAVHLKLLKLPMQVCWTWCWFAELAAVALFLLYRIGAVKVKELRLDLHEEKYLVGRQLNNLIRSHAISAPVGGVARPASDVSADMHAPARDL